jgi:hypothetical protein
MVWQVQEYGLNLCFLTCFLGEWMSLYIPRASENGITSVHPEEVPSF